MLLFDLCCGCRMHLAFICILGLLDDFVFGFCDFLLLILLSNMNLLCMLDLLFINNRLFFLRLRGLAIFSLFDIVFNSISGCLSRSCGMV